jgi:hypothetical protein
MATLADFVGTWYFRGYKTSPCTIRLLSATRLEVRDEHGLVFPARVDGGSVLVPEIPHRRDYPTGVITSDLKTIEWTNREQWKR